MMLPLCFSLCKISRARLCHGLLLLAAVILLLPAGHAEKTAQLPATTTYTLAKQRITLPRDLAGEKNILIFYFDQSQIPAVKPWMTEAQTLVRLYPNLRYYVLPVSSSELDLNRWWDNSALRVVFNDPTQWPSIVPLYVHKKRFCSQLGMRDEHSIYVLLTNKQGQVLWSTHGPLTAEQAKSTLAAIERGNEL